MSRRIIPAMFLVGMVLCFVLGTSRGWAQRPQQRIPDLRGHWDGFFLSDDNGGMVGLVRSDIANQLSREIMGEGQLGFEDQAPLESYVYQATVAASDVVTGTGQSTTGVVFVRGGLQTFAGAQGDAAIWFPDFRFIAAHARPVQLGSALLHPFPDHNAPDLGGAALQGPFQGQTDPTFRGTSVMTFSWRDRGSFPGTFAFTPADPNLHTPFTWPVRATTSAEGRFIMVGQGKTGAMSYNGAVIFRDGSPAAIWGIAKLSLRDGRVLFNAINVALDSAAQ